MLHKNTKATFSSLTYKRLLLGGIFALLCTFALQAQTIRYVKQTATGTGDGSSWENASADLQAMINYVLANGTGSKEVWVAAGTYTSSYYPFDYNGNAISGSDKDYNNRTFHVRNGVKIYGGFNAIAPETSLAARDIKANQTILDGGGYRYHVVLATSGATIDGFTISGGRGYYHTSNENNGYQVNGNYVYPWSGGGIHIIGNCTLTNNTFSYNGSGYGGAIFSRYGNLILFNNVFNGNGAGYDASMIYSNNGALELYNNTFVNNQGYQGIYSYGSCISKNNLFYGNLFYGDTGLDIQNAGGTVTMEYCLLQARSSYIGGTGNIQGDPLFVDAANNNFGLQSGSPCIDAGTPNGAPSIDIIGTPRVANPDIGAFELCVLPTDYALTGTGSYCNGGTGIVAGLPNSETGTSYQLKNFTTNIDVPILGTGAAISFSPKTAAGTYTVVATSAVGCKATMSGKININPTVCCPSGNTLYVNASVSGGTGDGTSWANAYASLGDALKAAHLCGQVKTIKVAQGTYKPTKKFFNNGIEVTNTDNRNMTFHLPDGVIIEGGYNATTGIRDIKNNLTILSGDIGTANVTTDNCYSVVVASAASSGGIGVTIDGFSITGGNGSTGGGISVVNGTNTISNNTIYNNTASDSGAGIYTNNSNNILSNNVLYNNTASSKGGGIYTYDSNNALSNNILYNNTASSQGGGIYVWNGEHKLSNNTLYNNTASSNGGGIYMNDFSSPNMLNNNIFWANKKGTADNVAGADYYSEIDNIFKNNILQLASSNYTSTNKNALATTSSGNFFAQNPNFVSTSNLIGADGKHRTADDGLQLLACSPAIDGGLSSDGTPNNIPTTDILGNSIYNGYKDIGAFERNSSINNPTKFMLTGAGNYCSPSTGNILGLSGSEIGVTYQLKNSAGTNVGTAINGTGAAITFAGNQATGTYTVVATRTAASCSTTMPGNAVVRLIPVCCPSTNVTTLHVNAAVVGGTGDGSTWANAYANLSDALRVAYFCPLVKKIKIASGTYKPSRKPFDNFAEMTTTDNRDRTFHIPDGVTIEGGYNATTGDRLPSFGVAGGRTILSGDIDNNDVIGTDGKISSGNANNVYHVILASAASTDGVGVMIDGCTIIGANANVSTSITVNGNTINRNQGGGIYTNYGTNTLSNNTLYNNTATEGGGIYTNYGTNTLNNNIIYSNLASNGGGISANYGTNTLNNNIIYSNSGRGIYTNYGTNTLNNNIIYSNSGGGISTNYSTNTLNNNTIYSNEGGGIYTYFSTNTLINNIFWANKSGTSDAVVGSDYYSYNSDNTFKNNLLQLSISSYNGSVGSSNNGLSGASSNNIFALNPGFVNVANPAGADGKYGTADDGLQLSGCSPAIDAGTLTIGTPALDILGNPIYNNRKDIGAYELQADKVSPVRYVNNAVSGGNGDGTSWANAYASLDDALAYARNTCAYTTIKVAAGTYKPTKKPFNYTAEITTTDNRDMTFHIPDGVTIEGGYDASTGTRTLPLSGGAGGGLGSILSGDIGVANDDSDNCYHVVLAVTSSGITIDGFSITGGRSNPDISSYGYDINGTYIYNNVGAGLHITNGNNTISNNSVYGNKSYEKSGIFLNNSTNIKKNANFTLTNNKVYGNSSENSGSGISANSSTITMNDNTVYENLAVYQGAGILLNGCTSTLNNNKIYGNYLSGSGSTYGSGLCVVYGSIVMDKNRLYGNIAVGSSTYEAFGGGAYIYLAPNYVLTNNTIYENLVLNGKGGGIYIYGGSGSMYNNVLYSNVGENGGGGIYATYYLNSDSLSMTNNTLYNNEVKSSSTGAGIYNYYTSNCTLKNNIFWANKRGAYSQLPFADFQSSGTTTAYNNIFQTSNNFLGFPTGNGNIFNQNPNFVNPTDPAGADGIHGTADDGLALQNGSLAINAGRSGGDAPTTDITGATRVGNPDIGAYEKIVACVPPIVYNVTGGGSFCDGDDGGVAIGLSNSEIGISYQLKKGTSNVGSAVSGTGAALSFGNQLAAGTYTVVATKTAGCTLAMTGSATITVNSAPTASIAATDNCGNSLLNLTISPSGAGAFLWSNAATTEDITVATAGTYTVTFTDANGCSATASGTAAPKAVPTASIAVTNNCGNSLLNLTTSGTDFLWSNGATTEDLTVAATGTYTVTITDANSCTTTTSEVAAPNVLPIAYNVTGGGTICSNDDGGVEIGLFNSGIGISYQLKNGANNIGSAINGTGSAISFGNHLEPGTYTVVATKASNGCSLTMTSSAVLTVNSAPSANITVTNNCGNSVLNLTTSPLGAGGSFLWTNAATMEDITVSTAGAYSVTVTNTEGCTAIANGIAMPNALPSAYNVIGGGDLCSNDDGGVEISLSNSEIGVSYQLKNGANNVGSPMNGTGAALSFGNHLDPGSYTVVATNASNGCSSTMTNSATITVHQYPTVVVTVTNNCGNSVLNVNGTGTSYVWSNAATDATTTVDNAGVYSVTVTGTGGCTTVESITASPKTVASVIVAVVNNCGNSLLSATATPTIGGTYLWSNAATTEDITVSTAGAYSVTVTNVEGCTATANGTATPNAVTTASIAVTNNCGNSLLNLTTSGTGFLWSNAATTEDITVYTVGVYTVTITNSNGCTATVSGTATPNAGPTANIAVANNCGNSLLTLTTNGTSYLWSNAATTEDITVSNAGTYTVTITDSNGCTATTSEVAAPNALPIAYNVTGGGTYCAGLDGVEIGLDNSEIGISYQLQIGNVNVGTAIAGTGSAISFGNQVAGTYTVVATNASNGCSRTMTNSATITVHPFPTVVVTVTNNCGNSVLNVNGTGTSYVWSNGANGQTIIVDNAGVYSVTATGVGGCGVVESIVASPKTAASVNITVANNCGNSVLNLTTSPSGAGDSFLWSNAATTEDITVSTAGNYSVTVTNAEGCTATANGTATPNAVTTASIAVTNNCGNSLLNLTTSGIGFLWSNAATTEDITVYTAGVYTVTITNSNGCTATVSGTATPNAGPTANIAVANNCGNSLLNLTTNGTSYLWSNAATTEDITVSNAGTYTVTITDSNGCTATTSEVAAPNALPIAYNVTGGGAYCAGLDGVEIGLDNSEIGISYQLQIGNVNVGTAIAGTGSAISFGNQVAGTYTVVATNASNGCSSTMTNSATITVHPFPTVVVTVTNNCGNSVLNVNGTGTSYVWSNGANGQTIIVDNAGVYSVTATGIGGCGVVESIVASPKTAASVNITVANNCGNSVLNLTTSPSGAGDSFLWSNAATTEDITVSTAGAYSVTVTNAEGCTATANGTATPFSSAITYNITGGGAYCAGLDGVEIGLDGSQIGLSYQLKIGIVNVGTAIAGTGSAISFGKQTEAGIYSVIATSVSAGCTKTMQNTATVTVDATLPAFVSASIPANVTINCNATIPTAATPTVTNSCSTVSLVETSTKTTNANECSYYGFTVTRIWTATDKLGNTVTARQIITVQDNVAPTIAPLANITVTAGAIPTTIANTDNCMTSPTVTFTETKVTHTPPPCKNYSYTLNRIWKVTDACGNSSTATQTIKAEGIYLTCPSDKTIYTNSDGVNNYNCSSLATAAMGVAPTFTDGCDASVLRYTITGATTGTGNGSVAGVAFAKGVSTITYNLVSSVSDQCSLNLTVLDNEAPKITLTPTVVLDACTVPNPIPNTYNPSVSDNCTGTNTFEVMSDVLSDVSGCSTKTAAQKYTKLLTRTWKATDANGNTATAVQNIYLRDMAPPITVCKNVTVNIGTTNVTYPVSNLNNESNDNCTAATALTFVGCMNTTTACTNFGANLILKASMIPAGQNQTTITVRVKARDACGNETATPVSTIITLKRLGSTMNNTTNGSDNSMAIQDTESSIPAEASTVPTVQGEMKCYPTPFSEDLNIQYNLTENVENVTLKLYDTQGRLVKTMEQAEQLAGFYQIRWNLSDLSAGMYHVCLELNGKCTKMERVIMMK